MQSNQVSVLQGQIHYLEAGTGMPIVFLHGMPTSSIIWKSIIPSLALQGRCIAPDLIGMGASSKPDIEYTVFEHLDYFEAFISALDLGPFTLVMHGWGAIIGFEYARQHAEQIQGLAFYESHMRPMVDFSFLSLPVQQLIHDMQLLGDLNQSVLRDNSLIDRFLPMALLSELSSETAEAFRAPFLTPESRKPLLRYAQEFPIGAADRPVMGLLKTCSQFLAQTSIPKCLLYGMPGFMTTMSTLGWAKINYPALSCYELGPSLHFAQLSQPERFSQALTDWYVNVVLRDIQLT